MVLDTDDVVRNSRAAFWASARASAMEPELSMVMPTVSGRLSTVSKRSIGTCLPSTLTVKSSAVRPWTGWPSRSVTAAYSSTRSTSTRPTKSGALSRRTSSPLLPSSSVPRTER